MKSPSRSTRFEKYAERVGVEAWLELGTHENHVKDAMTAAKYAYLAGYKAGLRLRGRAKTRAE